jgi:hypothetical protein
MASDTRKGPTQKQHNQEIRALCSECDRENFHTIVRSAEYESEYTDRQFSMTSWDTYQVIECRGCQTISFRRTHADTENTNHDPDTGEEELELRVELFPNRMVGRQEIDHTILLPATVRGIYFETLDALRGSLLVLTGIGIRALAEAMCEERGAQGRNLEDKLDDLVSQGVLSEAGAEILHSLRLMGNKAAHEVTPPSLPDLTVAFDVIEHALQGVYILPKLAENLPKRPKPTKPAS